MNARTRSVREVMQTEVAVLAPRERLDLADDVMRLGRVRHLPVLEGRRVVGIVSNRDLLAASLTKALTFESAHRRSFLRSVEVSEVMTSDPVTIGPDASLADAAQRMIARKIGCLPVVDPDGMLVGLVTETDLLEAALLSPEGDGEEGEEMSVKERLTAELEDLQRHRDEIRVRVHLGKAEAKEQWERAEHRFQELEGRIKSLSARAEEPLQDVADAARLLGEEIRDAYRKIRAAL